MAHQFAQIAFTPTVRQLQTDAGSRKAYARLDEGTEPTAQALGARETAFIAARDSFYMATVSETGWPYVQHRGGTAGFLQVLGPRQLGFFDYRGNRQYVSAGNLHGSDRASFFLMDYTNRVRLKLLGRAHVVPVAEGTAQGLTLPSEPRVHPEQAILVEVAGFDWNCPQHITERYTLEQIRPSVAALQARIEALEAELRRRPERS